MMSPLSMSENKPRRAEDSLFRMVRRWWLLLGFVLVLGTTVGSTIATRITAPAQVIELRARVDTVRTDVREMQHDLDAHVRGMSASRDTILSTLIGIREQMKLTVIGLCLAGQIDRSMRQQLHCDRDP